MSETNKDMNMISGHHNSLPGMVPMKGGDDMMIMDGIATMTGSVANSLNQRSMFIHSLPVSGPTSAASSPPQGARSSSHRHAFIASNTTTTTTIHIHNDPMSITSSIRDGRSPPGVTSNPSSSPGTPRQQATLFQLVNNAPVDTTPNTAASPTSIPLDANNSGDANAGVAMNATEEAITSSNGMSYDAKSDHNTPVTASILVAPSSPGVDALSSSSPLNLNHDVESRAMSDIVT
jgi:hypothetical protein